MKKFLATVIIFGLIGLGVYMMCIKKTAVDYLSGDYIILAGINADDVTADPLYADFIKSKRAAEALENLKKETGLAPEDIHNVLIAVNAEWQKTSVGILTFNRNIIADFTAAAQENKLEKRSASELTYYLNHGVAIAAFETKYLAIGPESEVKSILETVANGRAEHPVKDNEVLQAEYDLVDKSSTLWIAASKLPEDMNKGGLYDFNGARVTLDLDHDLTAAAMANAKSPEHATEVADSLKKLIKISAGLGAMLDWELKFLSDTSVETAENVLTISLDIPREDIEKNVAKATK